MRNNYGSTIVFKLVTKETTTVSIICKLETAAEYCGIESEPIYCKKLPTLPLPQYNNTNMGRYVKRFEGRSAEEVRLPYCKISIG